MELYINSAGIVSGAGNNSAGNFLKATPAVSDKLLAVEPDYTGQIPPMQLRRMSKAVRMGIGASKISMQQAGIEKPDAISVGTAMGCMQDTETFLGKMVEQNEQMLTPTAFIQSTHNTVSGQIALLAGCYGHNLTFVQRGHSFEHAMLNTALYLDENAEEKMLVGGIDELSNNSYAVMREAGVYNDKIPAGEGATFFVVTKKPLVKSSLCIKDIAAFTAKDADTATEKINAFIERNNLQPDLVVLGVNNDERSAPVYKQLQHRFANTAITGFKNLGGEYATASAFAIGLLMEAIKNPEVLSSVLIKGSITTLPGKILLVNNYLNYGSCWYMEVV